MPVSSSPLDGEESEVDLFIAKYNRPDFETLTGMIESGLVTPVTDRRYQLAEIADALSYLGEGHSHAKTVITI
jgi:NADPH:quinone reductase-like Zn-dependent oxidoreductase